MIFQVVLNQAVMNLFEKYFSGKTTPEEMEEATDRLLRLQENQATRQRWAVELEEKYATQTVSDMTSWPVFKDRYAVEEEHIIVEEEEVAFPPPVFFHRRQLPRPPSNIAVRTKREFVVEEKEWDPQRLPRPPSLIYRSLDPKEGRQRQQRRRR